MMNNISALANSLKTTFGLSTKMEYDYKTHTTTMWVYVDEFHEKYISSADAGLILDMVTKAFLMGSVAEHHYAGATYEVDISAMKVVEHIDRNAKGYGEWL